MLKKIPISDLQIGMYVHIPKSQWLSHPFLTNAFQIWSRSDIEKMRRMGWSQIQIDTEKGIDFEKTPETKALETTENEISFQEALEKSKVVYKEAHDKVFDLFENIKLGINTEITKMRPVVSNLVDNLIENEDTLLILCQMRHVDNYLFEHSVNFSVIMGVFAKSMGMEIPVLRDVVMGGLLHDLGKIDVPHDILTSSNRLTDDEYFMMKQHVSLTKEIISKMGDLPDATKLIALEHHERMDGSGYPLGLKGPEISLYGRMAAIVDIYDAITAERYYRGGTPPAQVLRTMMDWAGTQLDSNLLRQFIRSIGVFPVGSAVELTDGHYAYILARGKHSLHPLVRVFSHRDQTRTVKVHDLDLEKSVLRIVDFANFTRLPKLLEDLV